VVAAASVTVVVAVVAVAVAVAAAVLVAIRVTVVRQTRRIYTHLPSLRLHPFVVLKTSTGGDNRPSSLQQTTVYCTSRATRAPHQTVYLMLTAVVVAGTAVVVAGTTVAVASAVTVAVAVAVAVAADAGQGVGVRSGLTGLVLGVDPSWAT
jgi:hypothetical protein